MAEKYKEECIFCKIVKKEVSAEIVDETESFIAMLDINPLSKGHTLIIPKKHFVNIMDLPSVLAEEMIMLVKKIGEKRLREGAGGFKLIMNNFPAAGQIVMHAHLHLIPRKKDDNVQSTV